jgi:hypothetical protein
VFARRSLQEKEEKADGDLSTLHLPLEPTPVDSVTERMPPVHAVAEMTTPVHAVAERTTPVQAVTERTPPAHAETERTKMAVVQAVTEMTEVQETSLVPSSGWETVTFHAVVFVWYEFQGASRTEPLFPGSDGNLQVTLAECSLNVP